MRTWIVALGLILFSVCGAAFGEDERPRPDITMIRVVAEQPEELAFAPMENVDTDAISGLRELLPIVSEIVPKDLTISGYATSVSGNKGTLTIAVVPSDRLARSEVLRIFARSNCANNTQYTVSRLCELAQTDDVTQGLRHVTEVWTRHRHIGGFHADTSLNAIRISKFGPPTFADRPENFDVTLYLPRNISALR